MRFSMKLSCTFTTILVGTSVASPITPSPVCVDILIPVTVSATNVVIPVTTPPTWNQVSGSWNISALYCDGAKGAVKGSNYHEARDTLQVLVHGITYTSRFWSGTVEPVAGNPNSWIDYAAIQGYPTLSIDRLGNGRSDHPDPTTILQIPLHVEVIHQIIAKARAGTLSAPANKPWRKIIYVGHSFGSVIGNGVNVNYPSDLNATILTGLTSSYNLPFINSWLANLSPASAFEPLKWGNLPDGYMALINKTAMVEGFYYPGTYDPRLAQRDFDTRGTVGVGELQSALIFGIAPAPAYTRPVLDITGQHDALMCQTPQNITGMPYQTYDCGPPKTGNIAQTNTLYPNAKYSYLAASQSGHCWQFHYQAGEMFAAAHQWLRGIGL